MPRPQAATLRDCRSEHSPGLCAVPRVLWTRLLGQPPPSARFLPPTARWEQVVSDGPEQELRVLQCGHLLQRPTGRRVSDRLDLLVFPHSGRPAATKGSAITSLTFLSSEKSFCFLSAWIASRPLCLRVHTAYISK